MTVTDGEPQSVERMEELVDSVWSVVRQRNGGEDQWEGVQDSSRTVTDGEPQSVERIEELVDRVWSVVREGNEG